jgi:hypothetical protein
MILRNFEKVDWYGFGGAEDSSPTQPPMITEVAVPDTLGGVIVVDKNGIGVFIIISEEPFEDRNYYKPISFELGKRLVESWATLPEWDLLEAIGFEKA